MAAGLILQHEDGSPPALFGEWCRRRGVEFEVRRVWEVGPPDEPDRWGWICALGSDQAPGAADAPAWVAAEVAFLRAALAAGVPVLGLCFGGQALAAAAGAPIAPADPAEIGWHEIETADPERIPAGPWLHFHYDQLAVPAGGEELARSAAGPAAFTLGPSLGLQFHPEGTPAIADRWAAHDEVRLRGLGIELADVAASGREHEAAAARAAERLFDAWWQRLAPS